MIAPSGLGPALVTSPAPVAAGVAPFGVGDDGFASVWAEPQPAAGRIPPSSPARKTAPEPPVDTDRRIAGEEPPADGLGAAAPQAEQTGQPPVSPIVVEGHEGPPGAAIQPVAQPLGATAGATAPSDAPTGSAAGGSPDPAWIVPVAAQNPVADAGDDPAAPLRPAPMPASVGAAMTTGSFEPVRAAQTTGGTGVSGAIPSEPAQTLKTVRRPGPPPGESVPDAQGRPAAPVTAQGSTPFAAVRPDAQDRPGITASPGGPVAEPGLSQGRHAGTNANRSQLAAAGDARLPRTGNILPAGPSATPAGKAGSDELAAPRLRHDENTVPSVVSPWTDLPERGRQREAGNHGGLPSGEGLRVAGTFGPVRGASGNVTTDTGQGQPFDAVSSPREGRAADDGPITPDSPTGAASAWQSQASVRTVAPAAAGNTPETPPVRSMATSAADRTLAPAVRSEATPSSAAPPRHASTGQAGPENGRPRGAEAIARPAPAVAAESPEKRLVTLLPDGRTAPTAPPEAGPPANRADTRGAGEGSPNPNDQPGSPRVTVDSTGAGDGPGRTIARTDGSTGISNGLLPDPWLFSGEAVPEARNSATVPPTRSQSAPSLLPDKPGPQRPPAPDAMVAIPESGRIGMMQGARSAPVRADPPRLAESAPAAGPSGADVKTAAQRASLNGTNAAPPAQPAGSRAWAESAEGRRSSTLAGIDAVAGRPWPQTFQPVRPAEPASPAKPSGAEADASARRETANPTQAARRAYSDSGNPNPDDIGSVAPRARQTPVRPQILTESARPVGTPAFEAVRPVPQIAARATPFAPAAPDTAPTALASVAPAAGDSATQSVTAPASGPGTPYTAPGTARPDRFVVNPTDTAPTPRSTELPASSEAPVRLDATWSDHRLPKGKTPARGQDNSGEDRPTGPDETARAARAAEPVPAASAAARLSQDALVNTVPQGPADRPISDAGASPAGRDRNPPSVDHDMVHDEAHGPAPSVRSTHGLREGVPELSGTSPPGTDATQPRPEHPLPEAGKPPAAGDQAPEAQLRSFDTAFARQSDAPGPEPGQQPYRPPAAATGTATGSEVTMTAPVDGALQIEIATEELGRIRFVTGQDDGVLTVTVMADREGTGDLLRRNAADLAAALRTEGYGDAMLHFGGQPGHHDQRDRRSGGSSQPRADNQADDGPIDPFRRQSPGPGIVDLRL